MTGRLTMKRLRLSDPKEIARNSKSRVTGSAFLHPDRGRQWRASNGQRWWQLLRRLAQQLGPRPLKSSTPANKSRPRGRTASQPAGASQAYPIPWTRGPDIALQRRRTRSLARLQMKPAQTRLSSDPKPRRAFSVRSACVAIKTNSRAETTNRKAIPAELKNAAYSSVATQVSRGHPD